MGIENNQAVISIDSYKWVLENNKNVSREALLNAAKKLIASNWEISKEEIDALFRVFDQEKAKIDEWLKVNERMISEDTKCSLKDLFTECKDLGKAKPKTERPAKPKVEKKEKTEAEKIADAITYNKKHLTEKQVKAVQWLLKLEQTWKVDEAFVKAVEKFQETNKLTKDWKVWDKTLTKMGLKEDKKEEKESDRDRMIRLAREQAWLPAEDKKSAKPAEKPKEEAIKNPWPEGSEKAIAWAKLPKDVQQKLGMADPTDEIIVARISSSKWDDKSIFSKIWWMFSEDKSKEPEAEKLAEGERIAVQEVEALARAVEAVASWKETLTSTDIAKSIEAIRKIIDNWIESGEEQELTALIKDLQDRKIIKKVPGIKDGKLEKWQDLVKLWETVISRLEKVKSSLESEEANNKEKASEAKRKADEEKEKQAKTEADKKRLAEERLAKEKSDFVDAVGKIEISPKEINDYVDLKVKELSGKLDSHEEKVEFKEKVKPELEKLKVKENDKTFFDLTSGLKLEWEKASYKIGFNVNPSWFDSYDSKKSYIVQVKDLKVESNKESIKKAVIEAYKAQIDAKVTELTK